MPLTICADELRPGMKLHAPILSNGRVMMQAGKALAPGEVDVIRRRYPHIVVRVEDPVLDSVLDFEDDGEDRAIAHAVQRRVGETLANVQQRFARHATLRGADVAAIEAAVRELLEYLKLNPATTAVVGQCLDHQNPGAVHTGNVFYLSLLLGSAVLDYVAEERRRQTSVNHLRHQSATDLAPLGLAAMIMDLGLIPLQRDVLSKPVLTDTDSQAIRAHPIEAFNRLPDTISPVARVVVKTHHENYAGTGYPCQLPRDRVHVFARIVRIADAFAAATSDRPWNGGRSAARALWEMAVGPYKRFFDPRLMQAFTQLIQPFPIGAKLRLRDGRYAVVVRHTRGDPFRPIVMIAFDPQGQALPREALREPIHLAQRRDVRLASWRGEDLSFIYATMVEQAPVRQTFRKAIEAVYP